MTDTPPWRFGQLIPAPTPEDYQQLEQSITRDGFWPTHPVILDQHGNVIDGHTRMEIGQRLSIDVPTVVEHFDSEQAAKDRARAVNLARRQLTVEQKRAVVADVIREHPEWSDRRIAEEAQTSHPTVAKVRKNLESAGDVERVSTRTDTKGRKQAATKPAMQAPSEPPAPTVPAQRTAPASKPTTGKLSIQLGAFADLLDSTATHVPDTGIPEVEAAEVLAGLDRLSKAITQLRKAIKGSSEPAASVEPNPAVIEEQQAPTEIDLPGKLATYLDSSITWLQRQSTDDGDAKRLGEIFSAGTRTTRGRGYTLTLGFTLPTDAAALDHLRGLVEDIAGELGEENDACDDPKVRSAARGVLEEIEYAADAS